MNKHGSPHAKDPLMRDDNVASTSAGTSDKLEASTSSSHGSKRYPSYKLKYQDFIPSATNKDTYKDLLQRANEWLQQHHDVALTTCETLTWMEVKKDLLVDCSEHVVLSKCIKEDAYTYFKRGIRLWYSPRRSSRHALSLSFKDFAPNPKDTLADIIKKANAALDSGQINGKILTIETLAYPNPGNTIDSSTTAWQENSNEDIPFTFVLRVIYTNASSIKEHIGIKDFIPAPSPDGYEPFSHLCDKANTWLKDQTDIRVTNLKSVMVQRDDGPHSQTGSACFFFMPGLLNENPVEFFRILRLAYTKPIDDAVVELPVIYPFTFETFTPELMMPRNGKKRERMERMKDTFRRITSFLATSELEVICVEMVMNPMQMVMDEAGNVDVEQGMKWLLTTRLYLSGQITNDLHLRPYKNGQMLDGVPKSKSNRKVERRKSSSDDHPGPIFLANATGGQRPYKMVVVAVTVFVALLIIVVLSVVYSNQ